MYTPLIYLSIQTLILWALVIFMHRQKARLTLIPLYAYIAVLTLLTHNLSDLGFAVVINQWFFLIASFSCFTSVMLGVFFLYLFEGPRATRLALVIILFISFLYFGLVYMLGLQADTSRWVVISASTIRSYFWSILAIIVDVFFIAIVWELLGKIRSLPLLIKVFVIMFGTFFIDSIIFVSGVYGTQPIYLSVLQGHLMIRFALALIATPIASSYLKAGGYSEGTREVPKKYWEILNFRSDLETKIKTMEEVIKYEKELEHELGNTQETYSLALEGANAGIWDWDIVKNHIMYSGKFHALLGFKDGELHTSIEAFKTEILHPDDVERTFNLIQECIQKKSVYNIEYRLKTKGGLYKWFLSGGIVKFDTLGKPVRMVGSIIDIDEKKQLIKSYEEKVEELEKFNKLMVDRERKMIELKEELEKLKKPDAHNSAQE